MIRYGMKPMIRYGMKQHRGNKHESKRSMANYFRTWYSCKVMLDNIWRKMLKNVPEKCMPKTVFSFQISKWYLGADTIIWNTIIWLIQNAKEIHLSKRSSGKPLNSHDIIICIYLYRTVSPSEFWFNRIWNDLVDVRRHWQHKNNSVLAIVFSC